MPGIKSIKSIERLNKIAEYVTMKENVSVLELCDEFKVSSATIRRDLDILAEQKRIQRIHGGAIKNREAPPELPVLQRSNEQSDEKTRIGKKVASMIQDGETIFLGSGSTTFEVAKQLDNNSHLTIISNSLLVINELISCKNFDIITLGGVVRKSELSFIGHLTQLSLSQLHTDRVIMGIHAIDVEYGLSNEYMEETITDRTILQNGKQVIIVADHTKCSRVSKAFVSPIDIINLLVTGIETPVDFIDSLKEKGIDSIRV